MNSLVLVLAMAGIALAADPLEVKFAGKDVAPTANPSSPFWKGVPPVLATKNNLGDELPTNRTEIRVKWTEKNLYVLMTCPYRILFVLPDPKVATETNKLWERDVAEVFMGADFENINQYREYQVSPHGEWVDLYIDTKKPNAEGGWMWNSKMVTKARVDLKAGIWYAEFQIPMTSITSKKPEAGMMLRGNFYRFQGGPPDRLMVAWKPTGRLSNHTPEAFGTLRLVK